jgi:4-amino-4-deoxy-L-arabinose transferase-like glycosyltransferase
LKKQFKAAIRALFACREKSFLLAITLLALIIRLGIIAFAARPQQIIDDPHQTLLYEHGLIAHNLYTGHGFSMHWPYNSFDSVRAATMKQPPKWEGAFLPPLNPYLLYLSYEVFGENATALYAMMILYAIVSCFTPLAVYKLGRLLGSEFSARVSAIIALLFLPGAYAVVTFSGSALYQLLGVVVIYFAILTTQRPSYSSFLLLGLSCGIMTQLRSEFFFLGFLLIGVSIVLARSRGRHVFRKGFAAAVVCVAIIAPWTIRNYTLFHQFVPVLSHPWYEMWRGDNIQATGTTFIKAGKSIWVDTLHFPSIIRRMDSIPYNQHFEAKVDGIFKDEVITFIFHHPGQFLTAGVNKLAYLFTIDPYQPDCRNPLFFIPMLLVSGLSMAGLYRLAQDRFRRNAFFVISLFFGTYLFMTFMTVMLTRYQIYVFTCMLPVTGLGVFTPRRRGILS